MIVLCVRLCVVRKHLLTKTQEAASCSGGPQGVITARKHTGDKCTYTSSLGLFMLRGKLDFQIDIFCRSWLYFSEFISDQVKCRNQRMLQSCDICSWKQNLRYITGRQNCACGCYWCLTLSCKHVAHFTVWPHIMNKGLKCKLSAIIRWYSHQNWQKGFVIRAHNLNVIGQLSQSSFMDRCGLFLQNVLHSQHQVKWETLSKRCHYASLM